ncbi:hypothetical protein E4K72_11300 [Oxalobacteraceae bacterium OM1]|nr:hypothetical protein E4K72_11300 [Oxalobacteraceae bacterium OM1]
MSMLSMIFPLQAALPAAQAAAGAAVTIARPALGLSALAAVLLVFKPLLTGLLRAALLAVKPRQSLEERSMRTRMQSVLALNQMARDLDTTQPGLAAELRSLAARG